jgi:hypothetical protein
MRRTFLTVALFVSAAGCDTSREPRAGTTTTALTVDTVVLNALDNESKTAIGRSPVSVLVPKRPELLRAGKVMAEENWYAFNASHDGITVTVGASKIVHRYDDIAATKGKHAVRGVPGFVTRNEGIWTAAWRENGVYYALDVECGEPSDARCNDDTMLLELARDLVYVGGVK